MANPIEENATKILIALFENNPDDAHQFSGDDIVNLTDLEPRDINDAVDFLDDRELIVRLNYKGTNPFNFGNIWLNSRGKFLYHELKKEQKNSTELLNTEIISSQPLAAGSPFGFTDMDWEYVQQESNRKNTIKVVFGYQFKSDYYDSPKLRENVKKDFEAAIYKYNSRGGREKIILNFRPLAAGYGEHLFNQIARDIISSDIAVFEVSDLNPNVMLEMGVALTWGKRVLPIKRSDRLKPPSDISGQTYADYQEDGSDFVSETHIEDLEAMVERAIQKKRRS